jgi:RNA polymerase sigma-70 factor (ECF subfamily)
MTFSQEASEDILHDCFEKLIVYSGKYRLEDVNLRSFLYKTAHNLSVNHLHREKRRQTSEYDDSRAPRDCDDASKTLELDELNRGIYEFLSRSDPVSRSIFVMRKEQGMDIGAIAESLEISEKTVRRKLGGLLESMHTALKNSGVLTIFPFL